MAGLLGLVKEYVRINWKNFPDITTPLGQLNLNKMDYMIDRVEDIVVNFDTTKANQSDLLQTIKTVTYNETTGLFTFTFWNGSTYTADLNIEKIPVSFSMSPEGIITMITADGTTYTCDISTLIKIYSFNDSETIDFITTTDPTTGDKTIEARVKNGSITPEKLNPNFLADCIAAKDAAELAASSADADALISEGFAVGEQNGVPVPSTSPYYHNNAKYFASQAQTSEVLLDSGNVTIDPGFVTIVQDHFTNAQASQVPNNPTLVIATDTDYEVVSSIKWEHPTNQQGKLTINFWNPLSTTMTVNFKVYYKKS